MEQQICNTRVLTWDKDNLQIGRQTKPIKNVKCLKYLQLFHIMLFVLCLKASRSLPYEDKWGAVSWKTSPVSGSGSTRKTHYQGCFQWRASLGKSSVTEVAAYFSVLSISIFAIHFRGGLSDSQSTSRSLPPTNPKPQLLLTVLF